MAGSPFRIVEAIYPGITQLDFTAPHTVFSRIPNTETIVASEAGGPIESEGGLVFAGTRRLAEIDRCDLIFFPGGLAVTEAINNAAFMTQVRRLAAGARYLTSVCTGSLVLGAAGLLHGKRAACHWAWRDMLTLFGASPMPTAWCVTAISLPAAASRPAWTSRWWLRPNSRARASPRRCSSVWNMRRRRRSIPVARRRRRRKF